MTRYRQFCELGDGTVLAVRGKEGLDFLQRISTNEMGLVDSKGSVQTIVLSEKGRIIDVASVVRQERDVLLLAAHSPASGYLEAWLEKFIIMEDLTIKDVSADFARLSLLEVDVAKEGSSDLSFAECGVMLEEDWGGVIVGTLLVVDDLRSEVMQRLEATGVRRVGREQYEAYRILNGIPSFPNELNQSRNPLEAGLKGLISSTKGCYVGQEVIARLDTYKKVQNRLVKLGMQELPAAIPAPMYAGVALCGEITSVAYLSETGDCRGIGYVATTVLESDSPVHFNKEDRKIGVAIEGLKG